MGDTNLEIIDKCFDGIYVIGFTVKGESNTSKLVSVSDAIKLAKNNKITNAKCILDILNGDYMIKVTDTIDSSFKNSHIQLTLQCRLLDSSGTCIGYKAIDNNGKRYNLSIKKTWELAFNHNVLGVKATIIGGKKTLKSMDDFKLKDIPKIQNKMQEKASQAD